MRILILLFFIVFIHPWAMGQNLSFYGLLPAYSQTGKLGKKTNYNLFVSSTIDAFDKKVNSVEYPATDLQLYIQPSFIYVHSPNFNLAGSYTYVRNNPLNDNYVNEHRLWQQMIFSYALGKGKLNHRFRIEERFIEDKKTGHYPFHTRGRYQLAFSMPLQGRTLEKNEFYLSSYNEFYFSLSGKKNATYSENWSYLGVGFDTGHSGRIELGYLLEIAVRNQAQDLRFLNLAQVMWVTNFDFGKSAIGNKN